MEKIKFELSEGDLGWLAGMVDGEGSIGIHLLKDTTKYGKKSLRHRLSLAVINTNKEAVLLIQSWIGGSLQRRKLHEKNPNHQDVYRLRLEGETAIKAIERIYPYLRIKKAQAIIALEFARTLRSVRGNTRRPIEREVFNYRHNLYELTMGLNRQNRHCVQEGVMPNAT